MCFQICTITTNTRRARTVRWRQANPNNLRTVPLSSTTLLSVPIGLWNCQSAVNKADFIPSIATHSGLNLMALTETWIKPEDTATPALQLSPLISLFPTPLARLGGVEALVSLFQMNGNLIFYHLLQATVHLNLMQLLLPTLLKSTL